MLNCIWNKKGDMSVVETDEYEKLMATGDYYDNPWFDKHKEVKNESTQHTSTKSLKKRRSGHDLSRQKPGDDEQKTDVVCGISGVRRGDDQHGRGSSGVCSEIDEGNWPRVSSEIKEDINVSSAEDDK
jgi:hypothetical protein